MLNYLLLNTTIYLPCWNAHLFSMSNLLDKKLSWTHGHHRNNTFPSFILLLSSPCSLVLSCQPLTLTSLLPGFILLTSCSHLLAPWFYPVNLLLSSPCSLENSLLPSFILSTSCSHLHAPWITPCSLVLSCQPLALISLLPGDLLAP